MLQSHQERQGCHNSRRSPQNQPLGVLSNAIGALATDERPRRPTPGKKGTKRPNYRVIDRDHLVAWAEHNGYATEDQIDACLSIDTEERVKHLAN